MTKETKTDVGEALHCYFLFMPILLIIIFVLSSAIFGFYKPEFICLSVVGYIMYFLIYVFVWLTYELIKYCIKEGKK